MQAAKFARALRVHGETHRYRHCVLLEGTSDWQERTALELLKDQRATLISKQWCPPVNNALQRTPPSAVANLLGTEHEHLLIDAREGYDAIVFGIASGCVQAGGLLIILCPNSERELLLGFDQFCTSILDDSSYCYRIYENKALEHLPPDSSTAVLSSTSFVEQEQAIEAVCHVVTGQRKRPAVLIADRGRGKSAALGMAAFKLIKNGSRSIVVTGRSQRSAAKVFEHCRSNQLRWSPADQLLEEDAACELLLIDEAASLPLDTLKNLLSKYSRIALATTVHGYEGTGQGFMLRFAPILDAHTRGWRRVELATPIRWNPGDPLEYLTNRLLVQDASLPAIHDLNIHAKSCEFEEVSQPTLIQNEELLREIYSLLALAHYQTRPSDLTRLLGHPRMQIFRLFWNCRTVGVALTMMEGGLSEELSLKVFTGDRRPEGHALPEILASQLGQPQAATLRYARIMRIVIHPHLQRRGLGRYLLDNVTRRLSANIDIIGAQYSATSGLIRFWRGQQFAPIRISRGKSVKTGGHSSVSIKSITDGGEEAVRCARRDFAINFPWQLSRVLLDLDDQTVMALIENNPDFDILPDNEVLRQVIAYCKSQRNDDTLPGALSKIAIYGLFLGKFNSPTLWIERILLGRDWSECTDSAGHDGWKSGNRRLREDARQFIQKQFSNDLSEFENNSPT